MTFYLKNAVGESDVYITEGWKMAADRNALHDPQSVTTIDFEELMPFSKSMNFFIVKSFLKCFEIQTENNFHSMLKYQDVRYWADLIALSEYLPYSFQKVFFFQPAVREKIENMISHLSIKSINLFCERFLQYHNSSRIPDREWLQLLRPCEPFVFGDSLTNLLDNAYGVNRLRANVYPDETGTQLKISFEGRCLVSLKLIKNNHLMGIPTPIRPNIVWFQLLDGDVTKKKLYALTIVQFSCSQPLLGGPVFLFIFEIRKPTKLVSMEQLCHSGPPDRFLWTPEVVELKGSNSVWINHCSTVAAESVLKGGIRLHLGTGTTSAVRASNLYERNVSKLKEMTEKRHEIATEFDDQNVQELADRTADRVTESLVDRWKFDFRILSNRAKKEVDRRIEIMKSGILTDDGINGVRDWPFCDPVTVTSIKTELPSDKSIFDTFREVCC